MPDNLRYVVEGVNYDIIQVEILDIALRCECCDGVFKCEKYGPVVTREEADAWVDHIVRAVDRGVYGSDYLPYVSELVQTIDSYTFRPTIIE